jgi:hypothetical protein
VLVAECDCHRNAAARLFAGKYADLQGDAFWKAVEMNLARVKRMETAGLIPMEK